LTVTLHLRSTDNDITGPVTVNPGTTLRLAKHSCIGGAGIGAGDVTLNGGTLRNDDTTSGASVLSANRSILVGPGGATLSLVASSSQNLIYDGTISNSAGGGPLIKEGSGRLTLAGSNPNTYTGATTINAGRLILNKSSSNAVPGDLFVQAGVVQLTASHQLGDKSTVTVSGGLLGLANGVSDTVGQVVLDTGSITGAVSTLTATNFDFRSGTNTVDLVGNGNLVKTTAGTVVLKGNNAYTGTTTISNGILLVNGAIGSGMVTVSGGELAGIGTIAGPVEIESGGTLSPGQSIGRLTMTSSLELESGSITFIELNKAMSTNDFIAGLTNLSYGGALIATNVAGVLTTNDTFKLFEATTYDGEFSSYSLPALGAGLTWQTSSLMLDGTIKVIEIVTPPQQPEVTNAFLSGTNFVISGVCGTTNGTFYVLASSNVALPVTNWTAIATGQFGGDGQFLITNTVIPELPEQFFILQLP
jgi:autotransporter-associated beta strand protein